MMCQSSSTPSLIQNQSPQRVGAKGQSDCAADLSVFGKGHWLNGQHPASPQGKSDKSGASRRHVGGASVRRLSRKREVVMGVSPYIPCMWVVGSLGPTFLHRHADVFPRGPDPPRLQIKLGYDQTKRALFLSKRRPDRARIV